MPATPGGLGEEPGDESSSAPSRPRRFLLEKIFRELLVILLHTTTTKSLILLLAVHDDAAAMVFQ